MLTALHTKNWGERRVIRVIRPTPVTVLVSAEYHVSRPNRPPTALPQTRNVVVNANIVERMRACIVVYMKTSMSANGASSAYPERIDADDGATESAAQQFSCQTEEVRRSSWSSLVDQDT